MQDSVWQPEDQARRGVTCNSHCQDQSYHMVNRLGFSVSEFFSANFGSSAELPPVLPIPRSSD